MFRILFIFIIMFFGISVFAEDWTVSTIQQPIPYGQYAGCPTYQNNLLYNNPYYNPRTINQGYYPNSSYNVNYPSPYQYNNPYNYYNSSVYPGGLSNIGGNGVSGQILRNVGRNVLYSFMRGY